MGAVWLVSRVWTMERLTEMDLNAGFEAERSRLVALAARVLNDPVEAEDVVQQAWLRMNRTDAVIEVLPAWLTTVTTRLCLDRLKARTPVPYAEMSGPEADAFIGAEAGLAESDADDLAEHVALADTVGVALQVVLDRLTPAERVAFVLHDSFGFEFTTIAAALDTT